MIALPKNWKKSQMIIIFHLAFSPLRKENEHSEGIIKFPAETAEQFSLSFISFFLFLVPYIA